MKVICQNCFYILAERDHGVGYFKYDPNKIETIYQELNNDQCLLTMKCPNCGCMLQVRV